MLFFIIIFHQSHIFRVAHLVALVFNLGISKNDLPEDLRLHLSSYVIQQLLIYSGASPIQALKVIGSQCNEAKIRLSTLLKVVFA